MPVVVIVSKLDVNKLPATLRFLLSLVHHHHRAFPHCQALIVDRLLTFLSWLFSVLAITPSFSQSLSLYSHPFLTQAHL